MPAKRRMLSLDALQRVTNAHRDRNTGALRGVIRAAAPLADAIGGGELRRDGVQLAAGGIGAPGVAEALRLLQLLMKLGQPRPVFGPRASIDDRFSASPRCFKAVLRKPVAT